jgi:DNA polymerase III subunit chi
MAVARFYHLTRDPLEALLPVLIGKAREIGLTVALRGTDAGRMEALDRQLWISDGFLPHGLAGGAHDAMQPCLLTWDVTPAAHLPNKPGCLVVLDGAEVAPDEAQAVDRLCVVFDGTDPAAVERARDQWRGLTGAGVHAEYWSRESGRWECRAKHPKG